MDPVNSDQQSLAWLLISAIGGALAAIVVAGVLAGRLGLPLAGSWLLGAGVIGALPQLLEIAYGRWAVRWAELAATLIGFAAVGGVGLALAWPALLPLGFSVDAVHHTQLIAWMAEHRAIPGPGGSMQALLGEMAAYPIGLALLVLAAASGTGMPLLEATYPTVALLGGLIASVVVLLSSAASRGELKMENEQLKNMRANQRFFNVQSSILTFLALLVGPLLLLAHRTYLMEAYIDHSYYTMVLGVLLVLLATAWLLIEPPRSLGSATQLGLVLAALMGTYPLWAPLPAALALAVIVAAPRQGGKETRRPGEYGSIFVSPLLPLSVSPLLHVSPSPRLGRLALTLGPALILALLDVLPRMRIGQAVLAHEGLVTLPTPQRLVPILLALPGALLAARGRIGRGLVGMAALVALAIGALALAAHAGLAAGYHSYKLLFVLTPLAAAIVGAALARLVAVPTRPERVLNREERQEREGGREGSMRNANKSAFAGMAFWLRAHNVFFIPSLRIVADTIIDDAPRFSRSWLQPNGAATSTSAGKHTNLGNPTSRSWRSWRFIFELCAGWYGSVISPTPGLVIIAIAFVLALTGSFQIMPTPAAQVITPDMVAATRWLRANAPNDAARAITVGAKAGPLSYWIEVGLLGQQRDKAAAALRDFTIAPPTRESWLVDQQLAPVAITRAMEMPLPGESILARFGDVTIIRRADKLDPTLLNPLLIRYRSFWKDQRLKTAIELQRALPGPLPLLELRLYHDGAPVATFALPPEQDRTRPQYLGVDLLPATLGAEGYVNQSAYPAFAAPALAPTGALSLTLRLTLAGALIEERPLASFERAADGQLAHIAPSSGELIYLRHDPATENMRTVDLDFGGALRLTGWTAPARAAAGAPIKIGLRWQASQELGCALFPELLILNADGQPVASNLAAPQDGFYPTWRWRPGESVAEQRRIQLPSELPPGVYQVVARVHDFAAGRVLDVRGSADGLARIGEIVIE